MGGIDLPFLEKKLELLLGPWIPAAVKAVFEAVLSLFENEKQAAMIEKIAELETELGSFQEKIAKKAENEKILNEKNKQLEMQLERRSEKEMQFLRRIKDLEQQLEVREEKETHIYYAYLFSLICSFIIYLTLARPKRLIYRELLTELEGIMI